jgi:transglutaminase-like putative cysteine protease
MSSRSATIVFFSVLLLISPAFAQFKDAEPEGVKMGEGQTSRWRAGIIVSAVTGNCKGITGYVPVPTDWPEQQVRIVEEDVSPGVRVEYKMVEGTVKVMMMRLATLPMGQEARALVTLEIKRRQIFPPEKVDNYVIPDEKKLPREIRMFLSPSPQIESRDPKIRGLAKQIVAEHEKAWDKVEAIYDYMRAHVKYKQGAPLTGAVAVLKSGVGDCEDMTALFIALCRAADVPARTVRVPTHCYPEFYLQDEKGEGHWFPCQAAGSREFGGILELNPILQKGDNFRSLLGKPERKHYMDDKLIVSQIGEGKPRYRFVHELLPAEKK